MKLKSYFSATVEAAMDLARKELGPDALLVNAKPAPPEARYLGAYEVVFGLMPQPVSAPGPQKTADPLREELAELRRRIDGLAVAPMAAPVRDADVRVDPTLGSVVALVGPPGAGKTTALMKLAVRYGLARRKRTHILTADVIRIGAADQLRTLAAIVGIPCEVAETPFVLEQLLDECASKDLTLIDTPGFGSAEMESAGEIAEFLVGRGIDIHLVLPASMNPPDLRRVADAYWVFRPSKLLFTRLDEISAPAVIAEEAAYRGLPVSFLSAGQCIPEDLEEATAQRLGMAPRRMGAAA